MHNPINTKSITKLMYISGNVGTIMVGDVQQELAIIPAKMECQGIQIRFVSLLIDRIIISIVSFMI